MPVLSIAVFFLFNIIWNIEAAPPVGSTWKGIAVTILCSQGGSRESKATEIRDKLSSLYSEYHWFVNIVDSNKANSYTTSDDHEFWDNGCNYDMWIWYKEKSGISSCSTDQIKKVETLVEVADNSGSSTTDVREKLKDLMGLVGEKYHFIAVDMGYGTWSNSLYESCFVNFDGHYEIMVYVS